MIHCYGDSITKGIPGCSYIRYLTNISVKNYGLGGDTLQGLIQRVYANLRKHEAAHYIIQIGTNDLLLPFLMQKSTQWIKPVQRIIKRGSVPCEDETHFHTLYAQFVQTLLNQGKRITLVTIPCLGEVVDAPLNQRVDGYNQKIIAIAKQHDLDLIDFNTWQKAHLHTHKEHSNYFITGRPLRMIIDSVLTRWSFFSRYLSQRRGLHTTIDGCHLNQDGAKGLAQLIQMID